HKRGTGSDQWEPVRVRCGYDEGMMLAYELLDANGQPFASPAAPATATRTHCRRGHRCTTTTVRGKSTAKGKATAKSAKGNGTAKAKSASTSKSTAKKKKSTTSSN
ncbi:MAG: hypothetical protein ACOC8J_14620, partial [Ralstonia sp.]